MIDVRVPPQSPLCAAHPSHHGEVAAAGGGPPWPFTGRRTELREVEEALRPGVALFIGGRGGVGKTRFLRELGVVARAAGWLVTGQTSDGCPKPPIAGLDAWVSAGSGGIYPQRDGEGSELAASARRPRLVLVDDSHLLDDEQSRTLQSVLANRGVALVMTVNTDAHRPASHPLTALLTSDTAAWFTLDALAAADLDHLLTEVLGTPCDRVSTGTLAAGCNGNLVFLRELVHLGKTDGRLQLQDGLYRWHGPLAPTGALAAMVDLRLGQLDSDQREQLELLAQAQPLELRIAQHLMSAAQLAELERREVISLTRSDNRLNVVFASALYRERVQALTPPLRQCMHRARLATMLDEIPARRRGDLSRRVGLRRDAQLEVAPGVLLEAARDCLRTRRFDAGLPLAEEAHRAGLGTTATLLLAELLGAVGRPRDADVVLGELSRGDLAGGERIRVAARRAENLAVSLERPVEAAAILDEFARVTDSSAAALYAGARAVITYTSGDPAEALRLLPKVGPGSPGGDELLADQAWVAVYALSDVGRSEEALTAASRLLPAALTHAGDHPWLVTKLEFGRWRALVRLGRYDEADAFASGRFDECARSGGTDVQRVWSLAKGIVSLRRGLVRTALRELRESLDPQRSLPPVFHAPCQAAIAEAEACLEAGSRRGEASELSEAEAGVPSWGVAWQALGRGDLPGARHAFAALARSAGSQGRCVDQCQALHSLLRVAAVPAAARRLIDVVVGIDGQEARLMEQRALALVAGDAAAVAAVAGAYADADLLLEAAETACLAADFYRRQGRSEAARIEIARAGTWSAACEGARSPGLASLRSSGSILTPREREIAVLAASGLTSSAIAARLFLSVRTVESHLYNCYTKLGVTGRARLREVFGSAMLLPSLALAESVSQLAHPRELALVIAGQVCSTAFPPTCPRPT